MQDLGLPRVTGCGSQCNCPEVARNSPPFSDAPIVNCEGCIRNYCPPSEARQLARLKPPLVNQTRQEIWDTPIVNGNLTREPNYVILSTDKLGVADKVGRPGTTVLCAGFVHSRALSVTTLGHVHETGSGHFLLPQLRKKGGGGSGSQDATRPLLIQVTVPKWRSDFKQSHTDLSNETAKSGAVSY